MGSAAHVSWSFSRYELLKWCPRAFFWQYYPWDEDEQDEAWFLRGVTNLPMLVGTHVHEAIDLAIRQVKETQTAPKQAVLADHQVDLFRRDVRASARAVSRLMRGLKPQGQVPVLAEHLYGAREEASCPDEEIRIRRCLDNFAASNIWEKIKASGESSFVHVNDSIIGKPYFETGKDLGFPHQNVRVYAAMDLALLWNDDLIIFDWKTGKENSASRKKAQAQLSVYALWAWQQKKPRWNRILVQDVWLQRACQWEPREVTLANSISPAISLLYEHLDREMGRVQLETSSGRYIARLEEFQPRPSHRACCSCRFQAICSEGRKVIRT